MSKLTRYFSTVAVSVSLLLGAGAITAQAADLTSAQIDTIIQLLQSFGVDQTTINTVRISLGGSYWTPPGQAWCHTFNTNLGVGATGAEEQALEQALAREGFSVEHSSNFASVFNERIASAVTGFQEKYASSILTPNGLKHGTGYVGASTRAKLNQLYGCNRKPPVPTLPFCGQPAMPVCPPILDGRAISCLQVMPQPKTYTNYVDFNNDRATYLYSGYCKSDSAPIISGVSGPTSLQAGQQGTWTVKALDSSAGTLYYNVVWGDEVLSQSAPGTNMPYIGQQTTTFTHVYTRPGTYTARFYVSNSSAQAQTSISVVVY